MFRSGGGAELRGFTIVKDNKPITTLRLTRQLKTPQSNVIIAGFAVRCLGSWGQPTDLAAARLLHWPRMCLRRCGTTTRPNREWLSLGRSPQQ